MPAPYRGSKWRKVRAEILARDGGVCQIRLPGCTRQATQVDHINPVHRGGAWYDPINLRAACQPCNNQRVWNKQVVQPSRHW